MGAISHTINASLVEKLPYETVKEFTFIAHVVSITNMLVVHPSAPANNVAEFVALAKSNGKLLRTDAVERPHAEMGKVFAASDA